MKRALPSSVPRVSSTDLARLILKQLQKVCGSLSMTLPDGKRLQFSVTGHFTSTVKHSSSSGTLSERHRPWRVVRMVLGLRRHRFLVPLLS
jgi:hypothetical protein